MKYSLALLSLAAAAVNAHFSLTYPTSRGDSDETQSESPCGGLNTPSKERSLWGTTGGTLKFEAGHDEADTAVYLAIGNNPVANDFNITLSPVFMQIGLGTFCWNTLSVPDGTPGVADGVNATIQVVQRGHTGGGLYNCADITFTSEPVMLTQDCVNGTGVSGEAISSGSSSSAFASATASGSATTTTNSTSTSTSSASNAAQSTNAAAKLTAGGVVFAGLLAALAL